MTEKKMIYMYINYVNVVIDSSERNAYGSIGHFHTMHTHAHAHTHARTQSKNGESNLLFTFDEMFVFVCICVVIGNVVLAQYKFIFVTKAKLQSSRC